MKLDLSRVYLKHVYSLVDVDDADLGLKREIENVSELLVKTFSKAPRDTTDLDASHNQLGEESQLFRVFCALPPALLSLDLSYNGLGYRDIEALVKALKILPKTLTALNLSANDLNQQSVDGVLAMLAALPKTITSLNLSNNALYATTPALAAALAYFFSNIPANVTSLNLSGNHFYKMPKEYVISFLRSLPDTIKSLELNDNGLCFFSSADLAEIMAAIPKTVTSLSLRGNEFSRKSAAEFCTILKAIPSTVNTLNLGRNGLGGKSTADLIEIFSNIPKNICSLCLSVNELGYKRPEELEAILKAIPSTVERLDLRGNEIATYHLFHKAFASLRAGATALDLRENRISDAEAKIIEVTRPTLSVIAWADDFVPILPAVDPVVLDMPLAGASAVAVMPSVAEHDSAAAPPIPPSAEESIITPAALAEDISVASFFISAMPIAKITPGSTPRPDADGFFLTSDTLSVESTARAAACLIPHPDAMSPRRRFSSDVTVLLEHGMFGSTHGSAAINPTGVHISPALKGIAEAAEPANPLAL